MASSNLMYGKKGKDTDSFTTEELREYGRRGGIASGKAKRARKQMRETISMILEMPMKTKKGKENKMSTVEQIKSLEDVRNHNPDVQTAILLAVTKKALAGDIVAATFLRDSMGENPYILAQKETQNNIINDEAEQITNATEIVFRVKQADAIVKPTVEEEEIEDADTGISNTTE